MRSSTGSASHLARGRSALSFLLAFLLACGNSGGSGHPIPDLDAQVPDSGIRCTPSADPCTVCGADGGIVDVASFWPGCKTAASSLNQLCVVDVPPSAQVPLKVCLAQLQQAIKDDPSVAQYDATWNNFRLCADVAVGCSINSRASALTFHDRADVCDVTRYRQILAPLLDMYGVELLACILELEFAGMMLCALKATGGELYEQQETIAATACTPAQTCCSERCVDAQHDTTNCGVCGKHCPSFQSCVMGTCTDRNLCANDADCDAKSCERCLPDPSSATNALRCAPGCGSGEQCCRGTCASVCDACATDQDCDAMSCKRCVLDVRSGSRVCTSECSWQQTCCEGTCSAEACELHCPPGSSTPLVAGKQCCADGRQAEVCCDPAHPSGPGCPTYCPPGSASLLIPGHECCADGTQGPSCCGSTALGVDQTCCGDPSAESSWPLVACSAEQQCLVCQPGDPINFCVSAAEKCCFFTHIPQSSECCGLDAVRGAAISCPEGTSCLKCGSEPADIHCAPTGYQCCESIPIPGGAVCCGLDSTGTSVSWCPAGTLCKAGGLCGR